VQGQQLAELRRELDSQQVAVAEVARHQLKLCDFESRVEAEFKSIAEHSMEAGQAVTAKVEKLRRDLEALQQRQVVEHASVMVEWEQHKARFVAMEDTLAKLQEEVAGTRELQRLQGSQVESLVRDIRGNVDSLREETQQWAHSSEEVRSLHQDIMRSTGGLSRVIEDVSAAVATTERNLRQELEATRLALEVADEEQRAELSRAFACTPQVEPLVAAQEALRRDVSQLEASFASDSMGLRVVVDAACQDISQLQAQVAGDRAAHASTAGAVELASRCAQEVATTASDRLGRLEAGLQRLEAAEAKRCPPGGIAEESCTSGLATAQDIQDVWDVLSMLRASLQARESAVRAEADARNLEKESQEATGLALGSRVAALEERMLRVLGEDHPATAATDTAKPIRGELGACFAAAPHMYKTLASDALFAAVQEGPAGGLTDTGGSLRAAKPRASAPLLVEATGPLRSGDLTAAEVAQLPTPQAMAIGVAAVSTLEAQRLATDSVRV